jgi:hypothetical protein
MRIVNSYQRPPEAELRRVSLAADEWELVWDLREVPSGPRKAALMQLLRDIVSFVADPGCAEAQADGVPCSSVSSECAQCRRVDACLALLHETLHFR